MYTWIYFLSSEVWLPCRFQAVKAVPKYPRQARSAIQYIVFSPSIDGKWDVDKHIRAEEGVELASVGGLGWRGVGVRGQANQRDRNKGQCLYML